MIELIIGGARSGKSRYALSIAEAQALKQKTNLHFIATAEAGDDEMSSRIERHRQQRSSRWQLVEEPRYLSRLTEEFGKNDVILVDCLTLWLSNWLCSETPEHWYEEQQRFQQGLQQSLADWLLVSNDVGMGITPTNRLSREFIDESGWLHQRFAQIATRVTTVMYGIPQHLKIMTQNNDLNSELA